MHKLSLCILHHQSIEVYTKEDARKCSRSLQLRPRKLASLKIVCSALAQPPDGLEQATLHDYSKRCKKSSHPQIQRPGLQADMFRISAFL